MPYLSNNGLGPYDLPTDVESRLRFIFWGFYYYNLKLFILRNLVLERAGFKILRHLIIITRVNLVL